MIFGMKNTEMNMEKQFIDRLKTSDNRKTNRDACEIYGRSLAFFNSFLNLFTAIFKMISVCLPEDI